MARTTSIYTLPEDVRRSLNSEIVARGFSQFDHLALWLKLEHGFHSSRSAIHRYATKYKDEILDDARDSKGQIQAKYDLRMRALEIAQRADPDPSTLIKRAEEYLKWACSN